MKIVDEDGVTRWLGKYRGIVSDRQDPNKQGCIRLLIPDVMGGVESNWALPCFPSNDFRVPENGDQVWVEFEQGDVDRPIYVGHTPSTSSGAKAAAPNQIAEDDDTTALLIGKGGGKVVTVDSDGETVSILEPVTISQPQYPDVRSMRVGKCFVEVDGTPNEERIHLYHPSGAYYEIGQSGQIRQKGMGNHTEWLRGSKLEVTTGQKQVVVSGKEVTDNKKSVRRNYRAERVTSIEGSETKNVAGNEVDDIAGSRSVLVGGALSTQASQISSISLGNRSEATMGAKDTLVTGPMITTVQNKDFATGQTVGIGYVLGLGDISWEAKTGNLTIKGPVGELSISIAGDITAKNALGQTILAADGSTTVTSPAGEIALSALGDFIASNKIGEVSFSKTGAFEVKNAVGTFSMNEAGMFKIQGVAAELLTLFDQLVTELLGGLTPTMIGPQPMATALPGFAVVKALLATLKG